MQLPGSHDGPPLAKSAARRAVPSRNKAIQHCHCDCIGLQHRGEADMSVKCTVTWGKEVYKDVDIDTTQEPATFKFQLYSLTGVPPERQKIMGLKGGLLKDSADWKQVGLKPGQKLMLMGTAEKVPEAPKNAPVFMEDLPEEEQDTTGLSKYGAGLENAGNTCYMNSSIQCLYRVPEVREALKLYDASPGNMGTSMNGAHRLTAAAKGLFRQLEDSRAPVVPYQFLVQLRQNYPQFAEQSPQTGAFKQQDAEECWTQLLYTLNERLKEGEGSSPVVQRLFGIQTVTRLKCEQTEETSTERNTAYALKCNIAIDTNLLDQGLRLGLKDDREKTSAVTNQMALFQGSSQIEHLPKYLPVQMMRFYYKVDVRQKAKILRKVAFPMQLDCYEYCTEEYRKELDGARAAAAAIDNKRIAASQASKAQAEKEHADKTAKTDKSSAAPQLPASAAAEPAPDQNGAAAASDEAMPDADAAPSSSGSSPHTGKMTGRYDLVAVLTHKGRSADSGHYVAWVKQTDGQWINFDDENLIQVKESDVLGLGGGGDWHMANLLLYCAQTVPEE